MWLEAATVGYVTSIYAALHFIYHVSFESVVLNPIILLNLIIHNVLQNVFSGNNNNSNKKNKNDKNEVVVSNLC